MQVCLTTFGAWENKGDAMEDDKRKRGHLAGRPQKNDPQTVFERELEIKRRDIASRRAEGWVALFEKLAASLGRNRGGVRE